MMSFARFATILLTISILVLPSSIVLGRRIGRAQLHHSHHHPTAMNKAGFTAAAEPEYYQERNNKRRQGGKLDTLQIAGSSLPDCSHACGSCVPCRLVMVSFACASLEEAETCPMAYKCMCHSKSYPVP